MYSQYERRYLDLLDRAIRYEKDWWRENPGVHYMFGERPGLSSYLQSLAEDGGVTTADVYQDADSWHRFRQPVHSSANPALQSDSRRGMARQAYIFCGIPGSGKTTRLSPLVTLHRASIGNVGAPINVVNCDDIREKIPEYDSGVGSGVVQDESAHLTYRVRYPNACTSSADILIDSLGRLNHVQEFVRRLSDAKCVIHILLASCPVDDAKERVYGRALATGRLVPLEILEDAETDVKQTALHLQNVWPEVSSWAILATGNANAGAILMEGTPPWVDLLSERTRAPS
ncbi:zeta toxin family protein [Streptomyces sp. NPDC058301]|uniref:zeta toxin family protein n=1 Tax=Streptomyces sp. NPDC058301 TaxID=3346436 RepID=UPI0036E2CDB2